MPPRGNRSQLLGAVNRVRDARSRGMQRALEQLLLRLAVAEAAKATRELKSRGLRALSKSARNDERVELELAKAAGDDKLERDMLRLLQTFGLRFLNDAAKDAASLATGRGTRVVVPATSVDSFMSSKEVRLAQILRQTRTDVRNSVRDIVRASLRETPQPSAGTVARRIRNQFHGAPGAGGRPTGVVREGSLKPPGLLQTDRITTSAPVSGSQGILYAFSSERAALIARTELGQATNTGIYEGYKVSGVERIEWLAVTSDFRSGSRRHWEMDGDKVDVGETFLLPDKKTRMRYPHDPLGPIKHIANCRCTHRPVIQRRRRRRVAKGAPDGRIAKAA